MSRDTVSCHECGTLLGTLNVPPHGRRVEPVKDARRVVTLLMGVKVFCNFVLGRAEIICPCCGSCGRTIRADRFRGVVVQVGEFNEATC